jgi:hypothetical protein
MGVLKWPTCYIKWYMRWCVWRGWTDWDFSEQWNPQCFHVQWCHNSHASPHVLTSLNMKALGISLFRKVSVCPASRIPIVTLSPHSACYLKKNGSEMLYTERHQPTQTVETMHAGRNVGRRNTKTGAASQMAIETCSKVVHYKGNRVPFGTQQIWGSTHLPWSPFVFLWSGARSLSGSVDGKELCSKCRDIQRIQNTFILCEKTF